MQRLTCYKAVCCCRIRIPPNVASWFSFGLPFKTNPKMGGYGNQPTPRKTPFTHFRSWSFGFGPFQRPRSWCKGVGQSSWGQSTPLEVGTDDWLRPTARRPRARRLIKAASPDLAKPRAAASALGGWGMGGLEAERGRARLCFPSFSLVYFLYLGVSFFLFWGGDKGGGGGPKKVGVPF